MLLIFLSLPRVTFLRFWWDFKLTSKFKDSYLTLKSSFPPFLTAAWMLTLFFSKSNDYEGEVMVLPSGYWTKSCCGHTWWSPTPWPESSLSLYLEILKDLFLEAILCYIQKPGILVSSLWGPWSSIPASGLLWPTVRLEWTWTSGLTVLENLLVVGDFLPLGVAEFAGPNLLDLLGSRRPTPTQGLDHQVNLGSTRPAEKSQPSPLSPGS